MCVLSDVCGAGWGRAGTEYGIGDGMVMGGHQLEPAQPPQPYLFAKPTEGRQGRKAHR